MGLRFIRKPSDTPNVQNYDDTRMIRYAYGGYDGYVQKRGNELAPSTSGLNFMIGTGVISLQGYESEIDAGGWEMTVTNSPTKHYYSVFYEVNLATQTTAIKSTVSTSAAGYPDIPASDDLTKTITGVATLLLYHLEVQNGVVTSTTKKVKPIPYLKGLETGEISAGAVAGARVERNDNSFTFNENGTDLGKMICVPLNAVIEYKIPLFTQELRFQKDNVNITIPNWSSDKVYEWHYVLIGDKPNGEIKRVRGGEFTLSMTASGNSITLFVYGGPTFYDGIVWDNKGNSTNFGGEELIIKQIYEVRETS